MPGSVILSLMCALTPPALSMCTKRSNCPEHSFFLTPTQPNAKVEQGNTTSEKPNVHNHLVESIIKPRSKHNSYEGGKNVQLHSGKLFLTLAILLL